MKLIFCTLAALGPTHLIGVTAAGEEKAIGEDFVELLRVVEDKDGTTNVRSGPSQKDKVTGTVQSGAVVGAGEQKGDWTYVEVESSEGDDHYIHSSRLKKLEGWKQFTAEKSGKEDTGTARAAGMEAVVKAAAFVEKDHKVTRDKDGHAEKLDGKHFWGTDGELPKKSLSLTVTLDGKAIAVPAEAVRDLYEPDMTALVILTLGKPGEQAVVAMWNSDGAGGYLIAWSFVAGKYAGRTIVVP